MLRLSLICLALGACVKPSTSSVAPHSSYDLYNLCGESKADGVCRSAAETGAPLVDTNLSEQPDLSARARAAVALG